MSRPVFPLLRVLARLVPVPALVGAALLAAPLVAVPLRAATPAPAASLTGTADHAFMGAEETFNYVLSLAGGDSHEPPDLSPLSRDFEIVSRNRRSHMDVLNGRPVEVDEWVMTLSPKRAGMLTVPGLTVDGLTSKPLKIQVLPALPTNQPDDLPLFVRVDVADASPYAQSLIPVVLRIFDSLGMREGRIGLPTAQGGALTPQGEQRTYVKTIGKRRYGIIEQSYLLQPQKSGTVEIDPVTVEATVPGQGKPTSSLPNILGRQPILPWQGEEVTVRSRPVMVDVKARPAGAVGWFLPAEGVSLTQEWSSAPDKAQVGAALTRTVRLKAKGASPNQLPPLPLTPVDGLRQYEDDSSSERVTLDGMAGAELVKTFSLVPTRAGTLELPALEVGWWNTRANRQELAVLPAVTLQVAAAPGAAPSEAAVAAAAPPPAPQPEPQVKAAPMLEALLAWLTRHGGPAVLAAAGALALLLAGVLAWRRAAARRRHAAPSASPAVERLRPARPAPGGVDRVLAYPTETSAEQALVKACRSNDAQTAHRAFLAWVRLSGSGGFHSPRMGAAVRTLCHALYGAEAAPWKGRAFLAAFRAEQRARRRSRRSGKAPRIAPLYPTG